jgi:hypothetical protein
MYDSSARMKQMNLFFAYEVTEYRLETVYFSDELYNRTVTCKCNFLSLN